MATNSLPLLIYWFMVAGDREKTVNIEIVDDSLYEGEEAFELNIITADNQDITKSATVTISDPEDRK